MTAHGHSAFAYAFLTKRRSSVASYSRLATTWNRGQQRARQGPSRRDAERSPALLTAVEGCGKQPNGPQRCARERTMDEESLTTTAQGCPRPMEAWVGERLHASRRWRRSVVSRRQDLSAIDGHRIALAQPGIWVGRLMACLPLGVVHPCARLLRPERRLSPARIPLSSM
jgi:hypothetical protein